MTDERYECVVACITQYQDRYYKLAYSYVKNKEEALDIVQNAVLRALENYSKLKNKAAAKTWLYRIVINEALRYLEKNRREILSGEEKMPETPYYEEAYERDDGVKKAVSSLPAELRTVIVLRYFEELSLKEIAEVTQTNLSTVKTRLYGAQRRLRDAMKEVASL